MIYLASQSPRRAELLAQINILFTKVDGEIIECREKNESAEQYVLRLAIQKSQKGFQNSPQDKPVLGADTVVVLDKLIFEKPNNQHDAAKMMRLLSGQTHQVYTAISLTNGEKMKSQSVISEETFKALSEQEISDYWDSKEPLGKAGGYGVQGLAAKFISQINGSYTGIVGLPLYETSQLITEFIKD